MVIFATIFVQEQNCFEKAAAQCLPRLHGKAATGGGGMDLESFVEPSKIAKSLEHFLQPDRTTVQWHVLCRNGQWLMVNPVCPHWAGEIGKVCKKLYGFCPQPSAAGSAGNGQPMTCLSARSYLVQLATVIWPECSVFFFSSRATES